MKKHLLLVVLSIVAYAIAQAQSITISDGTGTDCFSNDVHTYSGTTSLPTRNIYTGTSTGGGGSGGPSRVIWSDANNRWEVQIFDLGVWEIIHYNTTPTAPLAPSLSLGTWVHSHPYCNDLTAFSGTGTTNSLPVELMNFNATTESGKTLLYWATATESNNKGFEIEKSTDGVRFDLIGFVEGSGDNSREQRYAFEDAAPFTRAGQVVYYRLRQVDNDGQFEYSKVVSVRNSKGTTSIQVYPTTTTRMLTVTAGGEPVDVVAVINQVGQVVLTAQQVSSVDMSALPAGLYLVLVKARQEQATERVFKQF